MKKEYIVRALYNTNGMYSATIYYHNSFCMIKHFLWYTKKEVINILRNEYNCIVTNDLIKTGYDYYKEV